MHFCTAWNGLFFCTLCLPQASATVLPCEMIVMSSSQIHKMVEVGRDLWKSFSLNLLLRKGYLEPVAQEHVQVAFGDLRRRRLPSLSQQPLLSYLHKESISQWSGGTSCVSVCTPCLLSCHWAPLMEPGSILFAKLLSVVYGHWRDLSESSLLKADQSQFSQPFLEGGVLQSLHHACSPIPNSL